MKFAMNKFQPSKKKLTKRIVFLTLIIVCILFCWYENKHLVISDYTYSNSKVTEAFAGYRIVQISDLHNASFGKGNKNLIQKIKLLEPDIIVITGDIVDSNHTNTDRAISLTDELVSFCPVYYVTGNHEYWLDEDEQRLLFEKLKTSGVMILDNEVVEITAQNDSFYLIGLDDRNVDDGTLTQLVNSLPQEKLSILLAHEPQCIDSYSKSKVDLVLSGHAHGGQFRIPFIGGVVAPDQGFLPKYTEGTYEMDKTTMVVSRGLGNSIIPVRLFNHPEIVCVDLEE